MLRKQKIQKIKGLKINSPMHAEKSDESRVYELGFLLDPAIDENELGKQFDAIKDIFKGKKAEFISESPAKLLELFYTITKKIEGKNEKFDKAYFGWIKYEISQDEIENLDAELKNNKNIIRFILIKTVRENTYIEEKKRINPKYGIFSKFRNSEINKKVFRQNPEYGKPQNISSKTVHKESEAEIDKAIDELAK